MTDANVVVFRMARETRHYKADDLSGAGAARYGARWNEAEIPLVYASRSRTLAAMETLVHLQEPVGVSLPLARYLVAITIPATVWDTRERFDATAHPGWDVLPIGTAALAWGSQWVRSRRSLVAEVPSVIIPEEHNVLLNPLHRDAAALAATRVRRWTYDPRISR